MAEEKRRYRLEELNRTMKLRMAPASINRAVQAIDQWERGVPLKESLEISDEVMQDVYEFACTMGRVGRYEEARNAFLLLTTFDGWKEAKYVLGLATSHFLLAEYDRALIAFIYCLSSDPNDLSLLWYIIQCYSELNLPTHAHKALKSFLFLADGIPQYKIDCERGKLLFAAIEERLKEERLKQEKEYIAAVAVEEKQR